MLTQAHAVPKSLGFPYLQLHGGPSLLPARHIAALSLGVIPAPLGCSIQLRPTQMVLVVSRQILGDPSPI